MTIEQVKAEAKKRFDKELTDEQAQAWLEAHPAGELQEEELADVSGGSCGGGDSDLRRWKNLPPMGPCPRCGCNEHYRGIPPIHSHSCVGCKLLYLVDERRWANEYGR